MRGLCQNCCYLCTKCVSVLKDFRPIEGYHNLSHALILYSPQTRDIFQKKKTDACTTTHTELLLIHFSLRSKLGRLLSIYPILEPKLGHYLERFSFWKQWDHDFAVYFINIETNQYSRDKISLVMYSKH